MEITMTTIYWFTRLDALKGVLGICVGFLFTIIVIMSIITGIHYLNESPYIDNDDRKKYFKMLKTIVCLVITLFFTLGINVFVPNQRDAAAIFLVPAIVNNEDMRNITKQSSDILQLKLNEWIKEMSNVPVNEVHK